MQVLECLGDQTGYEALAPTESTGFTSSLIKPIAGAYKGLIARAILIGVEDYPIRFLLNGTAPTASTGMLLNANNYYTIVGGFNIVNFRCIDTTAGASSVKCLIFH